MIPVQYKNQLSFSRLTAGEAGLQASQTNAKSLYEVVMDFVEGRLLKPPHQRDMVWTDDKKRRWIERMHEVGDPVGLIVTYQVIKDGKVSPVFINDGMQRIGTLREYLYNPEAYDDNKADAEKYVRSKSMSIQHRHYGSHDDAAFDFQMLNVGTALTPFEFCRMNLSYMENETDWKPLLDDWQQFLRESASRIVVSKIKQSRDQEHKMFRDGYALLHRFLSKTPYAETYDVTIRQIRQRDLGSQNTVEWKLRTLIERISLDEGKRELEKLKSLVSRETALVETVWHDRLGNPQGTGITLTLYRWILCCAIWRRNNDIAVEAWEDFVVKLLTHCDGQARVTRVEVINEKPVPKQTYVFSLSCLSSFRSVCMTIDSELYSMDTAKKRRKKRAKLMNGYDNSHIIPFSQQGEGATIPEPASLNRARGAKPMDEIPEKA